MIRDPSDGSVKDLAQAIAAGIDRPVIETGTSGLPLESRRPAYQEKMERSREWLRKYRTDPESVIRKQGETE